jgi:acyl-CoA thioesterase FadM
VEFLQTVERESVLMKASIQVACVGATSFKPVQIPALVREKMQEKIERIS